ncbi:MAG TPA: tetratricopeptide repeat-containing sensor histidine kinase [Chitinophagaceae bacterium]|nr:tetratricopeptide repeat-containing sensor histidine kinase [Chitinophagaceae bacterium]
MIKTLPIHRHTLFHQYKRAGALVLLLILFCYAAVAQANWDTLFQKANQYRRDGEFRKAIDQYNTCLQLAKQLKDSLKTGNSLIGIGIAYDQSGNYEDALDYYFKALRVYESINNTNKMAGTIKNIGNTYRELKDYQKSYAFLSRALEIRKNDRDSTGIANVLNDIGLLYMNQDSNRKAQAHYTMVLKEYGRHFIPAIKAYVINNLGITNKNLGYYEEALRNYMQALEIITGTGDQYGIALITGNIGDLYYKKEDYKQSLSFNERSFAMAKAIGSNELLRSAYRNLANTYAAAGNSSRAIVYLKEEMKLKDTIYTEERARSYAEMEAKYQNEKKQREIQSLEQANLINTIEINSQRRTRYFLLGGIVMMLIIAGLLFRSYKLKQRSNILLNELNVKLAEADLSKTKLLSIISHDLRVPISNLFNFLQLTRETSLTYSATQKAALEQQVMESATQLLETMEDLLLWTKTQMDNFKPDAELIDAGDIIQETTLLYQPAVLNKNLRMRLSIADHSIIKGDINFFRIALRNIISNAIKFSPSGSEVTIKAEPAEDFVKISVQDAGPGMLPAQVDQAFNWNTIRKDSPGIGLRLVKEFTERMGGKLSVQSQKGAGTRFDLLLPAAN